MAVSCALCWRYAPIGLVISRPPCSLGRPRDALSMILQSVDEICGAGVTRREGYMHTPEMVVRTDPGGFLS